MLIAAVTLVSWTAMACAQDAGGAGDPGGGFGGQHRHAAPSKREAAPKPKVDERAYNAALKELPDKQYDAWHGVR